MVDACENSFNCTLEIDGVEIPRLCYPDQTDTDEEFFCDCSNLFGWTGENCDERSGYLAVLAFCNFIVVLIGFAIFFLSLTTVSNYWYELYKEPHPFDSVWGVVFKRSVLVCLTAFLDSIFWLLTGIAHLKAAFDFTYFQTEDLEEIVPGANIDGIVSIAFAGKYHRAFPSLGNLFMTVPALIMALSWIDVLEELPASIEGNRYKRSMRIFKNIAVAAIFLSWFVLIPLILANVIALITFIQFAAIFLLLLVCIVGRTRLLRVLKNAAQGSDDAIAHAADLVRHCSLANIILLSLTLLSAGIFLFTRQGSAKIAPGSLNISVIAARLVYIWASLLTLINVFYARKMLHNKRKDKKKQVEVIMTSTIRASSKDVTSI